jgi:hypothetical protein
MSNPDEQSEVRPIDAAMESDIDALLDAHPYVIALKSLIRSHRRLGSVLAEAELCRALALSRLANDVRLAGADNLLTELDGIAKLLPTSPAFRRLLFLSGVR